MKKLIVALGLLTLLSVAVPFTVTAASLALWPSQFKPASHTVSLADVNAFARWNFNWLSATDVGGATFEGEVKLPVGARITKLAVNAEGQGAGAALLRAKIDGPIETVAEVELGVGSTRGWYYIDAINFPVVTAGYKYWVHVDVPGSDAYVFGVRVSYR